MLTYLLKMIVCSGIFYLYYLFALRNKKFHRYNRFYLLFSVAASFLVPLITINMFALQSDNEKIMRLMKMLYANAPAEEIIVRAGNSFDWEMAAWTAVSFVSVLLLALAALRIKNILQLRRSYPVKKINGVDFLNTNLEEAPFSFMKSLFWRKDISLDEEAGQQITRHELAHIRERHSLDRLFLQAVKAVCWFNPVFYFIEKELILIHEYIADEEAIQNKDGRAFAAMLLRLQIPAFSYAPGHAVFYSSIKKRLQMLTNKQKTKFTYARRLLVLPLLGCVTLAFGVRMKQAETKEIIAVLEAQAAAQNATPALQDTVPALLLSEIAKDDSAEDLKQKTKDQPAGIAAISNGSGTPLIIVDGKEMPADFAENNKEISPAEKIAVFKGEEAVKKYGEKGKNGVVEITTKKNRPIDKALLIVDGKEVTNEQLAKINPGDIESINILKDEAAKSYGEKGKNGVAILKLKDASQLSGKTAITDTTPRQEKHAIVFTKIQEEAKYPGDWQDFLRRNLENVVKKNGGPPGQYRVTVSFIVDENGNISNVKAQNDPGYGAAKEAVRVVSLSGKWIPGKQNGRNVTSVKQLPVVFVVQE